MSRYICDGCGSDIENPVNISEPIPTIFSNLMVVTSDKIGRASCRERV